MNILNGDSAAGSLKLALSLSNDEIVIFHDVLSCGPLQKFNNIEEWVKMRSVFWAADQPILASENQSFDSFPKDFYNFFPATDPCTDYKLWVGTGLSDQLLLAFIVQMFDTYELNIDKLSIYQFESLKTGSDNDFPVFGIGLLRPDQLKKHPIPIKLNPNQGTYAKSAWDAFTDRSPEKYIQFMADSEPALPLLHQAMSSVIYRYPDVENGLTFWDEVMLKNIDQFGPKATMVIGHTLGNKLCFQDPVGDEYLFSRLKAMAHPELKKPLVTFNRSDQPMRKTEVRLTEFGKLALKNMLNVIEENGINDWVGGVNLDSNNPGLWLRNEDKLIRKQLNAD